MSGQLQDTYKILCDFKSSVRSYDAYGRLHISRAKITRPSIDRYGVNELTPDDRKLMNLRPGQISVNLYRSKESLQSVADQYAMMPLYLTHTNKYDGIDKTKLIGTVGSSIFVDEADGSIWADMCIWDKNIIGDIESGEIEELSAGYAYELDVRPGSIDGQQYDGIIHVTAPNHLALVKRGRAGSTVRIGDSQMDKIAQLLGIALDAADVTDTTKPQLKLFRDSLNTLLGDATDDEDGDDYDNMDDAALDAKEAKIKAAKDKRAKAKAEGDKKVGDSVADAVSKVEADSFARHRAAVATRAVIGDMAFQTAAEYYRKGLDELKTPHANINEVAALERLFLMAHQAAKPARAVGDSQPAGGVVQSAPVQAKPFAIDLDHIRRR